MVIYVVSSSAGHEAAPVLGIRLIILEQTTYNYLDRYMHILRYILRVISSESDIDAIGGQRSECSNCMRGVRFFSTNLKSRRTDGNLSGGAVIGKTPTGGSRMGQGQALNCIVPSVRGARFR